MKITSIGSSLHTQHVRGIGAITPVVPSPSPFASPINAVKDFFSGLSHRARLASFFQNLDQQKLLFQFERTQPLAILKREEMPFRHFGVLLKKIS